MKVSRKGSKYPQFNEIDFILVCMAFVHSSVYKMRSNVTFCSG